MLLWMNSSFASLDWNEACFCVYSRGLSFVLGPFVLLFGPERNRFVRIFWRIEFRGMAFDTSSKGV
jgi:hypothetical protein